MKTTATTKLAVHCLAGQVAILLAQDNLEESRSRLQAVRPSPQRPRNPASRHLLSLFSTLVAATLLSACGGDSGSTTPTITLKKPVVSFTTANPAAVTYGNLPARAETNTATCTKADDDTGSYSGSPFSG